MKTNGTCSKDAQHVDANDASEKENETFCGSRWIVQMRRGEEGRLYCDFIRDTFLSFSAQ